MKIQNNYKGPIEWWSYRESDTAYGIALNKGEIPSKSMGEWRDDSFPIFKLQIAKDRGWGINNYVNILMPGTKYTHDDNFIVHANGTAEKATLDISGQTIQEKKMVSTEFVDRRGKAEDREVEVTTKFYEAFSKSITEEQSTEHTKTWNVGGKIGGVLKKVKLNGSVGFEDKVTEKLSKEYKESVEKSISVEKKTKIILPGDKISMLKTVWLANIETGKVNYFGNEAEFSVPVSANCSSSLEIETVFDSPDDMDKETRAAWDKFNAS